jgi:oligopeptidase A
VAYVSEKLRIARYAFSEQEVKEYFPEPKVLDGLFKVVERLYQVRIQADSGPVWHPDVRFFRIERDGELIGQFYLDLYARDTKKGGAWMDSAITRRRIPGGIETPVAYLVCNFPGPVGGKPATFSHDDVITLFHEPATACTTCSPGGRPGRLRHPRRRMGRRRAAQPVHGNFCWEWDVVRDMTAHMDTGAPLPRELFDKMLAAKNFQSGMQTVRQLEFSLFDLLLHMDFDPAHQHVMDLLAEVRRKSPCWSRPNGTASPTASATSSPAATRPATTATSGPRCSADAFAAFEESGRPKGSVLDAETGERFWNEILAVGGSRRRSNPSRPSAAANRRWTPSCATAAW